MARNLKNLVEDYYYDDEENDEEEIGGIQKIIRHPKLTREVKYKNDNREIQKKRREKDKMRQASVKRYEDENE